MREPATSNIGTEDKFLVQEMSSNRPSDHRYPIGRAESPSDHPPVSAGALSGPENPQTLGVSLYGLPTQGLGPDYPQPTNYGTACAFPAWDDVPVDLSYFDQVPHDGFNFSFPMPAGQPSHMIPVPSFQYAAQSSTAPPEMTPWGYQAGDAGSSLGFVEAGPSTYNPPYLPTTSWTPHDRGPLEFSNLSLNSQPNEPSREPVEPATMPIFQALPQSTLDIPSKLPVYSFQSIQVQDERHEALRWLEEPLCTASNALDATQHEGSVDEPAVVCYGMVSAISIAVCPLTLP